MKALETLYIWEYHPNAARTSLSYANFLWAWLNELPCGYQLLVKERATGKGAEGELTSLGCAPKRRGVSQRLRHTASRGSCDSGCWLPVNCPGWQRPKEGRSPAVTVSPSWRPECPHTLNSIETCNIFSCSPPITSPYVSQALGCPFSSPAVKCSDYITLEATCKAP